MIAKAIVIIIFGMLLWVIADQAFRGEFTFGHTLQQWLFN